MYMHVTDKYIYIYIYIHRGTYVYIYTNIPLSWYIFYFPGHGWLALSTEDFTTAVWLTIACSSSRGS